MPHPLAVVALVILLSVVFTLMVKAILWIGRDARMRGFSRPWLLQVVAAMQFPWVFVMYYLVCRCIDEQKVGA